MQDAETERAVLADFEMRLSEREQAEIRRSVQRGIEDIDVGRFREFDDAGLRA